MGQSPPTSRLNSPGEWHQRYLQQAGWTRPLREHLWHELEAPKAQSILEVGCGTGAVLSTLEGLRPDCLIAGIDLDFSSLRHARQVITGGHFSAGDALALPFPPAAFDLVFCHYLLLWVKSPSIALSEMRRITRPGGHVIALAEPDYGGRIDYPDSLATLGQWQQSSLKSQGADPSAGRKLASWMVAAGFAHFQTGVLGGQWKFPPAGDGPLEWQVLENDLANSIPVARLAELKNLDQSAWKTGERVLYVPTFYAWAKV